MQKLAYAPNWRAENELIEVNIYRNFEPGTALQILEAGCGQSWDLNLREREFSVTGVDIDEAALEMRKNIKRDLDRAISGDLRYLQLERNYYDVIYSSFVLEHIKGAATCLTNFDKWCKPGGLIVIRVPDRNSAKGFITRLTPQWFHVFYYRQILGSSFAGKPGYGPYPVSFDGIVSRKGIHQFCEKNGYEILEELGCTLYKPGRGFVRSLVHSFEIVLGALSLGYLSATHSDLLFILQKRPS